MTSHIGMMARRAATNRRRFRRRSQGKNRTAIKPKSQMLWVYAP